MINKDIINIDDVLVIKTKDQFIKEFGDDWMSKIRCGWVDDMDYSFGLHLIVTKAIYENIKKYIDNIFSTSFFDNNPYEWNYSIDMVNHISKEKMDKITIDAINFVKHPDNIKFILILEKITMIDLISNGIVNYRVLPHIKRDKKCRVSGLLKLANEQLSERYNLFYTNIDLF